ncbi:hypothetical protein Q9295_15265 [Xinfangfangia sp. CPCC 101601]|uniref:Amidohydrolase-related domain-containing protein n=1 Tax=Pseudogemmobacter lacusdianii TaxID=3069608 RepID=A0ABU0W2Q8_9RHOB|nr:hypothetical protein [Xinfangfangia sp. CPCC 101601]MDQ2067735.1 hypothetical protein [Xinfangfangia sp. CPCC 101601]
MQTNKDLAERIAQLPVFDNHCHMMDPAKAQMTPLELAQCFYHGAGDIPFGEDGEYFWHKSPELMARLPGLGIVQTLVHRLSQRFGCEETLEAVAAERNRRTAVSYPKYINEMYDEAKIFATMVDAAGADDDPGMLLFPGVTLKTFQFDNAFDAGLAACDSFDALKLYYADELHRDYKINRAAAVKCHLAERFGLNSPVVTDDDARNAFAAAKASDYNAMQVVYVGLLQEALLLCAELDISIHFHTGMTGGPIRGL